jgi:hypothetical protein
MALIGAKTTKLTADLDKGDGAALGDRSVSQSKDMVFVQASAAIVQYDAVWIEPNFTAAPITSTLAATAGFIGVAEVAFASAEYGWITVRGVTPIRVASGCAPFVPLFTTGEAGILDDGTASASAAIAVLGVIADSTATSGVTGITCAVSWPVVRRPSNR